MRESMEVARIAARMSPSDGEEYIATIIRERERLIAEEMTRLAKISGKMPNEPEEGVIKGEAIVRKFFDIVGKEGVSLAWIEDRSGVPAKTIWEWRRGRQPGFSNFIACVQSLGYDLVIKEDMDR